MRRYGYRECNVGNPRQRTHGCVMPEVETIERWVEDMTYSVAVEAQLVPRYLHAAGSHGTVHSGQLRLWRPRVEPSDHTNPDEIDRIHPHATRLLSSRRAHALCLMRKIIGKGERKEASKYFRNWSQCGLTLLLLTTRRTMRLEPRGFAKCILYRYVRGRQRGVVQRLGERCLFSSHMSFDT